MLCVDTVKKIQSYDMDDVEFVVIFQILALSAGIEKNFKNLYILMKFSLILFLAKRLFSQNTMFEQKIQEIFVSLEKYFKNSYNGVALRMGNTILAITLVQVNTIFVVLRRK